MLIEKNTELNDIVVIKLVTQEELIAKVVAMDQDKIVIQKPMSLTVGMDERTGRPGIQMLPFFLLGADADARISIKNIHIVAQVQANKDIKSNYMSATSSLAIPASGSNGLIT